MSAKAITPLDVLLTKLKNTPALASVLDERVRQELKWGQQNHQPIEYLAILTEEVGELAKECVEERWGGKRSSNMRVEAVQVAAVALAIIECLDRNPK